MDEAYKALFDAADQLFKHEECVADLVGRDTGKSPAEGLTAEQGKDCSLVLKMVQEYFQFQEEGKGTKTLAELEKAVLEQLRLI